MADFLNAFKRRESDDSSEGSLADDDDGFEPGFVHEEIRHHSDEEKEKREEKGQPQNDHYKHSSHEEKKQIKENKQRKEKRSPNKDPSKNKDYYLYQGEEKPYESDPEEQGQGQSHSKRENQKGEKKADPTFVPKGTFYQHDTRGDDVEYVPKKNNDKLAKYKWKHDKFEKPYSGKYDKSNRDTAENNSYYEKKGQAVVMYVVKGETQQKEKEEEPQEQPQRQKQQRNQQSYEKEDYGNDNYGKGDYGKGNYGKEKDRGYNNSYKSREYSKKEGNKKSGGGNTGGRSKQEYVVEYVPKNQDKK
jgi:hypothetical protein